MHLKRIFATSALMLGASVLALGAQESTSGQSAANQPVNQQQVQQGEGTQCPEGWNLVDANSDGKVSQSELDRAVEAQFSAVDLDGNGSVSEAEYSACVMAVRGRDLRPHSEVEMRQPKTQPTAQRGQRAAAPQTEQTTGAAPREQPTGEQATAAAPGEQPTGQRGQRAAIPQTEQTTGPATGKQATAAAPGQQPTGDRPETGYPVDYPTVTADDVGIDPLEPGFTAADADKSGDVSREEAAAAAEAAYQAGSDRSREQHAQTASRWFDTLDRDGDDKLVLSEWLGQHDAPGYAGIPASGFVEADTDSSGTVSQAEYREAIKSSGAFFNQNRSTQSGGSGQAAEVPEFSSLDTDRSGDLSQSEWQAAAGPADVSRDFAELDANGDGEISQSEWRMDSTERFDQASAQGAGDGTITVWHYYIY